MILLQRKEEASRALQNYDNTEGLHLETFSVATELMGLAIGSHGANIVNARNIEGVKDIQIDETTEGESTFKVRTFLFCWFLDILRLFCP